MGTAASTSPATPVLRRSRTTPEAIEAVATVAHDLAGGAHVPLSRELEQAEFGFDEFLSLSHDGSLHSVGLGPNISGGQ